jgi:spore coat protein A
MKVTRREFLKYSAIAGAATVLPWKIAMREAYAQYIGGGSPNLQKFIQPLRSIGGIAGVFTPTNPLHTQQAIPVAGSDGTKSWGTVSATHYKIDIRQFTDQLHPALPAPTTLWGFHPVNVAAGNPTPMHLGGVIATGRGVPVQITFSNRLTSDGTPNGVPLSHIIPVDTSIPGPNQQQNRTAVHIHGGYVPWISDGGPFDWWMPDGQHGLSFLNNKVLRPEEFIVPGAIPTNEAEYYYPNDQSARLVWYHDHAWGITRINAYAGIASGYVITDAAEAGLAAQGVPGPLDARTFYLVFQDKVFKPDGSLFYANVYDPLLFGPAGVPSFGEVLQTPFPATSVVPEFFGDTILVNGTVYPYIEVQPKTYRFRMLNACNSRFLNPRLLYAMSNNLVNVNSTEPNTLLPGPSFTQIGTEGGFLPAPVLLNGANTARRTLMSPAERADIIVDFSAVPVGSVLILYSDSPGPFPGGSKLFDYHPLNPKTPTSLPGFGPNTRTLLQIRVVAGTPQAPPIFTLPPLDPPVLVNQVPGVPIVPVINRTTGTASVPGQTNVKFRSLTLNEGFDQYGRLAQYIGTNTPTNAIVPGAVAGFYGQRYTEEAATEVPLAGAVEIWEIANLSADTHPLHFHLVNVQILARQPINLKGYNGTPTFRGKAVAPDAIELGWKETVRMNPGEVIWVIMKFEMPAVPFTVPTSPRAGAGTNAEPGFGNVVPAGATANEYVWHCHILEHEEHDMMRPLVVVGDNPTNGVQVRPATAQVTGAIGGTAQFTIFGGKPGYDISPNTHAPSLDGIIGQVVTLTVAAATPAGQVVYTITDSATPTPGSAQFTLNIV